MLLRLLPIACLLGLSASAQPPMPEATRTAKLCATIASKAFEANRGLQASNLTDRRKAPFVSSWLVQNGLVVDGDGQMSVLGADRKCDGPVVDRCYQVDSAEWISPLKDPEAAFEEPHLQNFEDFVRWTSPIGLWPHDGEFLEVLAEPEHGPYNYNFPSGAFLTSVVDANGLMCAFDNRLHERSWSPERVETESSCASLLSNGSDVIEPDLDTPANVTQAMLRLDSGTNKDGFGFYDFDLLGALKLDVDGDGLEEHLIKVHGRPGHGRCSGRTYYDVLDSSDPKKFSSKPVRALVLTAQMTTPPCGYETRIRRNGGRILFEVAGLGLGKVEKPGVPLVAARPGLLERQLREISGNNARYICSTQFSVEPVVIYAR